MKEVELILNDGKMIEGILIEKQDTHWYPVLGHLMKRYNYTSLEQCFNEGVWIESDYFVQFISFDRIQPVRV